MTKGDATLHSVVALPSAFRDDDSADVTVPREQTDVPITGTRPEPVRLVYEKG